jgi:WD40 repeat protein
LVPPPRNLSRHFPENGSGDADEQTELLPRREAFEKATASRAHFKRFALDIAPIADVVKSPESIEEAKRCRQCGAVLDRTRLGGLCPACTWSSLTRAEEEQTEAVPAIASDSLLCVPGHIVLEEIARGGMGIVYRARQLEPDRIVALKMLLPQQLGSAGMRDRFRMEIRAIGSLEHPRILPVYQVGEHDGFPFFTMKFASGGTLATRADNYRGQFREIAELMATLADAVQFAHSRGVLHRDLKPGNILFDDAGRPYVSDFGLAKFTELMAEGFLATQSVRLEGTPQFLAPEAAGGTARAATISGDIYSLGAILYELLTGQPPHTAENLAALLKKIVEEDPVAPSKLEAEVPRDLEVICLKCLEKEPARRYASAAELANDLRLWLSGRPITARPVGRGERLWKWAKRNPMSAALAGSLFVALTVGGFALQRSNRGLVRALGDSSAALHQSLLAQARFQRATGRSGQRFETIGLLKRATALEKSARNNAELRTEVAGALALPDVRITSRWPVFVPHYETRMAFSTDLERYAGPVPEGGFTIFATKNRKAVRHFAGNTNNPVLDLRFDQDGKWIAATFQDGHAEIHSCAGDGPLLQWSGKNDVRTTIEFVPHATAAVIPIEGRGLVWCDLATGEERQFLAKADRRDVMRFDPSGAFLVIGHDSRCELWRVADRSNVWSQTLSGLVSALAWSRDSSQIAAAIGESPEASSAKASYGVVLLNSGSGAISGGANSHENPIAHLIFAGNTVVTGGWDGRLVCEDLHGKSAALVVDATPRALMLSRDGKRIGFSPSQEELAIGEVASAPIFQEWRKTSPTDAEVYGMSLSADGELLAVAGDGGIHLWDTRVSVEISTQPLPAKTFWTTVFFHPDGQSVVYSAANFGVRQAEVKRTADANGRTRFEFGPARRISPGDDFMVQEFAPDRKSLVVGEFHQQTRNDRVPPTFWLWPDGDPARARKLAENFPMTGYRLAAGGRWGISTDYLLPDLWLWNPQTGERVRNLGIPLGVSSQISHDGSSVITSTREEFVLWDVESWQPKSRWPARPNQRTGSETACSRDGKLLAAFDANGGIDLFALPEGRLLLALPPPGPMRLQTLVFSPNADRLYALRGNGTVYEWKLAELRKELVQLGLDFSSR